MRSTALAGKPLPMHSVIHAQQESKFSSNTVSANCGCWCETMVVGLIHKRWTRQGGSVGAFGYARTGGKNWGEAESQEQRQWRGRSGPARPRPRRFLISGFRECDKKAV